MIVSYIVPHRNRLDLFEPNLASLLAQTDRSFEVVVVDHSDEPVRHQLIKTIERFRTYGMRIRLLFIDPTKHPFAHKDPTLNGNYNPALAQNIGVKKAAGEVIVLTSPEVVNARGNVQEIRRLFAGSKSRFLLGWIDERPLHVVRPYLNDLTTTTIKTICAVPGPAAMCRDDVPARPWLPINYFLGMLRKEDFLKVGGVDERFLAGVGWEDNSFNHCLFQNGLKAEFCGSVAGIHLTHSRSYQVLENVNKTLWLSLEESKTPLANEGLNWGSDEFITGEA